MDLQLNGKTALVTGATGGIGLAIAQKLPVEGAKVTIAGRTQAKLDEAVANIHAAGGAHVSGVLADTATAEGAATLLGATPFVDILVNNLGVYETRDFVDITDEDWRMIEPDEIASLVAYVASLLSSATNGAALRVDGGVIATIG